MPGPPPKLLKGGEVKAGGDGEVEDLGGEETIVGEAGGDVANVEGTEVGPVVLMCVTFAPGVGVAVAN